MTVAAAVTEAGTPVVFVGLAAMVTSVVFVDMNAAVTPVVFVNMAGLAHALVLWVKTVTAAVAAAFQLHPGAWGLRCAAILSLRRDSRHAVLLN